MSSMLKVPTLNNNSGIDPIEDLKFVFSILLLIISFFSRPVIMFLRRGYGERYLSFWMTFITYIALQIVGLFSTGLSTAVTVSTPLLMFSQVFMLLATYHAIVIIFRNYNGDYSVLSNFPGQSWSLWHKIFKIDGFFNRLIPDFVIRVVEPALVYIVGAVIMGMYDTTLGVFIQFMAVCLVFDEQINWKFRRRSFLDKNDSRLMAEQERWETEQQTVTALNTPPATAISSRAVNK